MNIYSLSMQIFNKTQVNDIALALKNGKAAILPTDTVWGIACLNEQLIHTVKKRDPSKKVIKFVASIEQIGIPSFFGNVLKEYMPGPLSVIWKGYGFRIPNSSYIIELAKQVGPIYCSSANISGEQPIKMSQQVFTVFKDSLNFLVIVDNSPYDGLSQQPSTIIDLDNLSVIREGAINGNEVIDKLKLAKQKEEGK